MFRDSCCYFFYCGPCQAPLWSLLDKVVKEKFHNNADDTGVRNQAIKFLQMFRTCTTRDQTIVDILHASQISRRDFKEALRRLDS